MDLLLLILYTDLRTEIFYRSRHKGKKRDGSCSQEPVGCLSRCYCYFCRPLTLLCGERGTLHLTAVTNVCLLRSTEGQQVPAGELLQQRAPSVPDKRLHF